MDYLKALENAIIYIENHLGEAIMVEDVASAAGYSYYHLTRQFSVVLGESVGSYIKKRRLADGAKKLLYSNKRIIDIAMENGFDSSEAFSRAFKVIYKVSPSIYRKNRLDCVGRPLCATMCCRSYGNNSTRWRMQFQTGRRMAVVLASARLVMAIPFTI